MEVKAVCGQKSRTQVLFQATVLYFLHPNSIASKAKPIDVRKALAIGYRMLIEKKLIRNGRKMYSEARDDTKKNKRS